MPLWQVRSGLPSNAWVTLCQKKLPDLDQHSRPPTTAMHRLGHHVSQGSNGSTSGPGATLHSVNSTSPHCSYQQTFPLHYSYSYLHSLFCIAIKHKWINSLSHPYFMSSSLAKITMALALGVSRSCLIILSKSMVLSLRSWGIFRDWAMQSPPV